MASAAPVSSSLGPPTSPSSFVSWVSSGAHTVPSIDRIANQHCAYVRLTDLEICVRRIRAGRDSRCNTLRAYAVMTGAPMSDHPARRCASCSVALAPDDRADLCEPCEKTAQVAPDVPPVLSADFWEQPEIRSVLLSRHFGHFLRTYPTIQSPQVNQSQLAQWLGITQGQLSRIERATTPIRDLDKLDT